MIYGVNIDKANDYMFHKIIYHSKIVRYRKPNAIFGKILALWAPNLDKY
jgi:hypothetical protein